MGCEFLFSFENLKIYDFQGVISDVKWQTRITRPFKLSPPRVNTCIYEADLWETAG